MQWESIYIHSRTNIRLTFTYHTFKKASRKRTNSLFSSKTTKTSLSIILNRPNIDQISNVLHSPRLQDFPMKLLREKTPLPVHYRTDCSNTTSTDCLVNLGRRMRTASRAVRTIQKISLVQKWCFDEIRGPSNGIQNPIHLFAVRITHRTTS